MAKKTAPAPKKRAAPSSAAGRKGEQRPTVRRRAYEYDHEYGIKLSGKKASGKQAARKDVSRKKAATKKGARKKPT